MQEEILSTKENASVIISILKELDKRIENYKRENEIYNFTDIAHLAIKVVKEIQILEKNYLHLLTKY